ncbi:MAG: hypothetical protein Q7T79_00420, partial [bacterium]|nr:hypothetical protein [bacterium]
MIKNLDGIKKLTPDEVKKSREIVLDFIGENEAINNFALENKIKSQDVVFDKIKKVDGITKGKEKNIEKLEKSEILETEEKFNKQEDDIIYQEKQKLIEEKKKQQRLLEEQESLRQFRDKEEKLKEKELKNKQEKNQKEQFKKEQIKKLEEEKLKLEEKNLLKRKLEQNKQLKKQEKKNNLIKKVNKFKKKFNFKISLILKFWHSYFKKITVSLMMLFLLLIIFYIIFCEIVLSFGVDNKLVRQVAKYLFVPALISNAGMVDYYSYKDKLVDKSSVWGNNIDIRSTVKNDLLKKILYKKLAREYGLTTGDNNLMVDLEKRIVIDKEKNQSSLARIAKINDLIKQGKTFEEVKKYSDEFESGVYMENDLAQEKFGKLIIYLSVGQISGILVGDSGYYLIKKNTQNDSSINISYVFIKAITLNDY